MTAHSVSHTAKVVARRLTPVDWCFINFKLGLGLVWPTALLFNIDQIGAYMGTTVVVWIWLVLSTVGFIVSLVGLIMGAQRGFTKVKGSRIEVSGLYLFLTGPLMYGIFNIIATFTLGWIPNVISQLFLAYALCAVVFARIHMAKSAGMKQEAV